MVFDHRDDDPADPSGTQVPAGGMLPFEGLVEAAAREVREETGLDDLAYVDQVGFVELGLDEPGGPSMTTYVHLRATEGGQDSWDHTVVGDGDDAGMVFRCRWERLPLTVDLADGQDQFLSALPG